MGKVRKEIKRLYHNFKENTKPDCVHVKDCLSFGIKCYDCENNKKNKSKKDYYKPKIDYDGRLRW